KELLETARVSDANFERAKKLFGERGVVDLVGIVGYYSLVALTLNAVRQPVPEGETPPFEPELAGGLDAGRARRGGPAGAKASPYEVGPNGARPRLKMLEARDEEERDGAHFEHLLDRHKQHEEGVERAACF